MWFDLHKKNKIKKKKETNNKTKIHKKKKNKQQKPETALKPAGLKNSKFCGVHNPFLSFSSIMLYFFLQEQADF